MIVDDEKDVLEFLMEILDMCKIDTASTFEEAKELLETNPYHIAVLDIMGVRGYELLEIANKKNIPALMLTAHALSPDHLEKSIGDGACCYLPKEEIVNIAEHLCDVLMAKAVNSKMPHKWFAKLNPCFERLWGVGWKEERIDSLRQLNLVFSKEELDQIL